MSTEIARSEPAGGLMRLDAQALLMEAVKNGRDVETLERLVGLAERMQATQARQAFREAMAAFQRDCPPIKKKSHARIKTRTGAGYEYAWAELDYVLGLVHPIMSSVGLSNTWSTEGTEKGVLVSCIISHVLGHSENTGSLYVPIQQGAGGEGEMGASPAQRVGIATSYGKRYTLLNGLGLSPEKEDKDGAHVSGAPETETKDAPPPGAISPNQVKRLYAIAKNGKGWTDEEIAFFLSQQGIASVAAIPVGQYNKLVDEGFQVPAVLADVRQKMSSGG